MQIKNLLRATILLVFCGACSTPKATTDVERTNKFTYSLQAGFNKGGMTENTNMADIPGAGIDAFSGATRSGFNAGARVSYPIKSFALEAGLDFMNNGQTFTWNDPISGYAGSRDFSTNQLMIPTTINIGVFKKSYKDGLVQFKLGHLLQYNLVSVKNESGLLPDYAIKKWSNGFTFGIATTPFQLSNGARLGLFLEAYRGSQIFEDQYNLSSFEMPGSSFAKFGVIYKFNID
jgi:hypothetical protein